MSGAPARGDVQAGAASLRETAKWTVGGLAAVAAAVVAGSPLTSLGSLGLGWRLGVAVIGAGIGFGALGFIVWRCIDMLAPRMLTFEGLVDGTALAPDRDRQCRIEAKLADQFPVGAQSFKAMFDRGAALEQERASALPLRRKAIDEELEMLHSAADRVFPLFDFEEIHDRFLSLRCTLFRCSAVLILGFGTFAWAANPGKDSTPALVDPYMVTLNPSAGDTAALRATLGAVCMQAPLRVLVLRETPAGTLEGVTVTANCPPVRVLLRDKGASIALQH